MQTFLAYPVFTEAAGCLDSKRLGNQRLEARILYQAITIGNGWSKHPAAVMWKGYHHALALYQNAMCLEWKYRGFNQDLNTLIYVDYGMGYAMPPWLGNKAFHESHRSNLLKKDPKFYEQFKWGVPHDLPYVWPRNWGRVYEEKDMI